MTLLTLAVLALSPLAAEPLAAQPCAGAETAAARPDEVVRLAEWPAAEDTAAVKRSVSKIRKARNDEMEAAGLAEVEAAGASAAPILITWLGKERDADVRGRLVDALDSVTAAEHTRLLAKHFEDDSDTVRRYAVRRVAVLGDPGLREVADARYDELAERAADPRRKAEVDPLDLDLAATLCLASDSPKALERALALAEPTSWTEWGPTLARAAEHAKASGTEVADGVAKALGAARKRGGDANGAHVAALHLLTHAGSPQLAKSVLPSLDDEANQVKVAAINALRKIVDGDEPLEKLSTFDAIERANKWKQRL